MNERVEKNSEMMDRAITSLKEIKADFTNALTSIIQDKPFDPMRAKDVFIGKIESIRELLYVVKEASKTHTEKEAILIAIDKLNSAESALSSDDPKFYVAADKIDDTAIIIMLIAEKQNERLAENFDLERRKSALEQERADVESLRQESLRIVAAVRQIRRGLSVIISSDEVKK